MMGESSMAIAATGLASSSATAATSVSAEPDGLAKAFGRAPVALIVEDNAINQRLAVALVKRAGCTAVTVDSGPAAIERVKAEGIDVVLMDIQMPGMDGLQATRAIRALAGEAARVPVIAMTAHVLSGAEEQCRASGMNDYISKPIDPDRLKSSLQRCLLPRQS